MNRLTEPSIHIIGSTTTEGVALPYNVSMLLNDVDNHKAFRKMMAEMHKITVISVEKKAKINGPMIYPSYEYIFILYLWLKVRYFSCFFE